MTNYTTPSGPWICGRRSENWKMDWERIECSRESARQEEKPLLAGFLVGKGRREEEKLIV